MNTNINTFWEKHMDINVNDTFWEKLWLNFIAVELAIILASLSLTFIPMMIGTLVVHDLNKIIYGIRTEDFMWFAILGSFFIIFHIIWYGDLLVKYIKYIKSTKNYTQKN
jgi:hypothetical protein